MSDFNAVCADCDSDRLWVKQKKDGQVGVGITYRARYDGYVMLHNADAHRLADWLFKRGFGSTLSALTRLESEPAPLDDASTELEALRSRADTASDVLNFHRKRIENIEARLAKLEAP